MQGRPLLQHLLTCAMSIAVGILPAGLAHVLHLLTAAHNQHHCLTAGVCCLQAEKLAATGRRRPGGNTRDRELLEQQELLQQQDLLVQQILERHQGAEDRGAARRAGAALATSV
jgi:hypothetical protein